MRCSCLFAEYVGRVRKDGGKATAVSTVVPSMFGNSVRISSQTIPAYDPALWPQMESTAAICSACLMLSAMESWTNQNFLRLPTTTPRHSFRRGNLRRSSGKRSSLVGCFLSKLGVLKQKFIQRQIEDCFHGCNQQTSDRCTMAHIL